MKRLFGSLILFPALLLFVLAWFNGRAEAQEFKAAYPGKGVVTVKDLRREDQFEVARSELVKTLRVELEQAAAMG